MASGSFEAASAFANFAQSIRHRQAAIRRSISELEAELEAAREANVAAFREWKRVDVLRARQMAEEAAARSRREQMDLDELALRRHRSQ